MRASKLFVLWACLLSGAANATPRYAEATIVAVETGEAMITVFLAVISGDAPLLGNGGTNGVAMPYVLLANSATDVATRKHMLASVLAAHSVGAPVRVRWNDVDNRVEYLLVRN